MARRPPKFQRLIAARETLADRHAGDIDVLSNREMIRGDFSPDRNQAVLGDAKFRERQLRLDLGDREAAALGFRDVLHLGAPGAELHGGVAVLVLGAMGDDLAALEREHGHRHMIARICEDAGHAQLLCDNA